MSDMHTFSRRTLSGRNMRLCTNHYVRLVIASDTVDEMNSPMDAVRIRISPWQLVYRRIKENPSMRSWLKSAESAISLCSGPVENWKHETSCIFVEETVEGAPIAEVLNLLSGSVETVGIFVRRCLPVAKDYAEEIADYAKCVTVVNSALQEVAMCASKAETRMEMKHVKVEWLRIHALVEDLRGAMVTSMIPVLHSGR